MRWAQVVQGLFVAQFVVGLINLVLLAPVWMQMVHLLMADLSWLSVLFLGAATLAEPEATAATPDTRRHWRPRRGAARRPAPESLRFAALGAGSNCAPTRRGGNVGCSPWRSRSGHVRERGTRRGSRRPPRDPFLSSATPVRTPMAFDKAGWLQRLVRAEVETFVPP